MSHPFVFVYTNQIKFHVHALQSCLLFPYTLPKHLHFLFLFPNLYLSQSWRLWTWAHSIRARGSPALEMKTEVVFPPSVLACLTPVGGTPFCRSKFCLAQQLSNSLIRDGDSSPIFLTPGTVLCTLHAQTYLTLQMALFGRCKKHHPIS
jgi:hypothetical protein